VYVTSGQDTEIRLTIEALIDVTNALAEATDPPEAIDPPDIRTMLHGHGFSRAATAPPASIERVEQRVAAMSDIVLGLPRAELAPTVTWINTALSDIPISPSVTDHDGADLHLHWTPASATFDDQVIADFLMAVAQEICDHGTTRFGHCAATDCERLFYDATRNGSRRFCNDQRCASRTHTADHRRRQRAN